MNGDLLEATARISKENRRRAWQQVFVIGAIFIFVQTLFFSIIIWLALHSQDNLSARVDRNLAYTICVLATPPSTRGFDDYLRCYEEVDAMYPHLNPPLPSPVPQDERSSS